MPKPARGGFYLTYPMKLTPEEHDQLNQLRELYNVPASVIIRNMIKTIVEDPNGFAAHEIIIRTENEGLQDRYLLFRTLVMALERIDKVNITSREKTLLNELLTEMSINIGQQSKETVFELVNDIESIKYRGKYN